MKLQFFFKIFFTFLFSFSSFANESIDTKVKKLTLELRCMTCQNQSVHDSDSDYSNSDDSDCDENGDDCDDACDDAKISYSLQTSRVLRTHLRRK